jgi:tetratricopeptide (TPR) repeat protein
VSKAKTREHLSRYIKYSPDTLIYLGSEHVEKALFSPLNRFESYSWSGEDKALAFEAYMLKGDLADLLSSPLQAIHYYKKAAKLGKDDESLAEIYFEISSIHCDFGERKPALDYLKKACKKSKLDKYKNELDFWLDTGITKDSATPPQTLSTESSWCQSQKIKNLPTIKLSLPASRPRG